MVKNWQSLKKLNRELPYDPAIPLLGISIQKIFNVSVRQLHVGLLKDYNCNYITFFNIVVIVVQSRSHVELFATPWTVAGQASLFLTIS